jgi:MFS family permease
VSPLVTVILLIWVVGAIFAAGAIGNRKGRPGTGFLLGLFLGWIGVIIIALTPATHDMQVQIERHRLRIQREAQDPPPSRLPFPRRGPVLFRGLVPGHPLRKLC